MSVDNFVQVVNEMRARTRPFSYFDLTAEYVKLRVSHAELLTALEALLKVCDEELDPKRTPEMRDARIVIAKARGQ